MLEDLGVRNYVVCGIYVIIALKIYLGKNLCGIS